MTLVLQAGLALLAGLAGLALQAAASSDGWTPIIPEGGSLGGPLRHSLAVEPGLPGSLASSLSSSLASSLASSYHSQVDHLVGPGHQSHPAHPGLLSHPYRPQRPQLHAVPDYPSAGDTCALYKAAMTQDLYFQYIQYKVHMPDLKEFTLCMWHKFYNHSSDHPLFSYAIRDMPRAILSWVSATDRSTYFSMSVDGHTLFRLNYPLRLNRWYHSCQSWNGRTGEWQVWVNAERVGRGFHNLLVNHVIKGGGVAITGQEQRQYGGGFLEGEGAPKGSGGMLGEITQLQLYSVALTAGKAYRDHKHHHGNYRSEAGQQTRTTTPAPPPETTTLNPYAPFITNGQLTPQLPIFELSAFRKNIPMPPMEDAQQQQQQQQQQQSGGAPSGAGAMLELGHLLSGPAVSYLHMSPTAGSAVRIPLLTHPRPALDLDPQQHYVFKRDDRGEESSPSAAPAPATTSEAAPKVKRAAGGGNATHEEEAAAAEKAAADLEPQRVAKAGGKRDAKRVKQTRKAAATTTTTTTTAATPAGPQPAAEDELKEDGTSDSKYKRQTISLHGGPVELGGDIDTSLLSQGLSGLLPHGEFLGGGARGPPSPVAFMEFYGNHQQLLKGPSHLPPAPPPPPLKRENEPAEGEVMAVMAMCSGCRPDPFAKVNVISWQGTSKKLYSGVLYLPAKPVCRKF